MQAAANSDSSSAPGGRIALAVDDVQAAFVELKDKGVRFENEPQDYGCCKAVLLRDPDGNYVTLHRRADGTSGQEEAIV